MTFLHGILTFFPQHASTVYLRWRRRLTKETLPVSDTPREVIVTKRVVHIPIFIPVCQVKLSIHSCEIDSVYLRE